MKKNNILMIGHFATHDYKNDGQTVKTKEIYNEIIKNIDKKKIKIIDTQNWKKNKVSFLKKIIKEAKKSNKIILIVASGGAKVLIPILGVLKPLFKYKICYCVVGCWLDIRIKENKILRHYLKKIDLVLVETNGLKESLEREKYKNIKVMYNFKTVDIVNSNNLTHQRKKFCIFSRIMQEKGIEDAIYAISELNNSGIKCSLDIYGPIEVNYIKTFKEIVAKNKNYINYQGNVKPEESVKYLSKYDMLIFPTHYKKEGLPGTILDAIYSNTPIMASNWEYAGEFINNDIGYLYKFADKESLKFTLKKVIKNRKDIENKRKKCIKYTEKYSPSNCIKPIIEFINEPDKKVR